MEYFYRKWDAEVEKWSPWLQRTDHLHRVWTFFPELCPDEVFRRFFSDQLLAFGEFMPRHFLRMVSKETLYDFKILDWSDTFEHHACEINDSDQEEADLEDGLRLRFKRIG